MKEARAARVQVVWFKRDLRVRDHAPLAQAAAAGSVLALYLFEPECVRSEDWDPVHSEFIEGSLRALETALAERGVRLVTRLGEAVEALERLRGEVGIDTLWSHEETGNRVTFDRDVRVARWCQAHGIRWVEVRQDGVVRRLRERNGWAERWTERMGSA